MTGAGPDDGCGPIGPRLQAEADRVERVKAYQTRFRTVLDEQQAAMEGLAAAVAEARVAFQNTVRKGGYEVAQFNPGDFEDMVGELVDLATFDRVIRALGMEKDRDAIFQRKLDTLWSRSSTPPAGGGGSRDLGSLNASLEQLNHLLRRSRNGSGALAAGPASAGGRSNGATPGRKR